MKSTVSQPKGFCTLTTFGALALALMFSLLGARTAVAEPWQIGFAVGSGGIGNNDDVDLDFRGEVRVGKYLTDRFALEAQAIRAAAFLDSSLSAGMINGVFDLHPDRAVVPYLMAGAGYARLADVKFLSIAPTISSGGTALQVGVGSHFYFGSERRIALRVELSSLWEDTGLFEDDRHTSLVTGVTWEIGN